MWVYYSYDELYHHGILGMKWGKKNGPPYPLSPGDHSQSEKKAGWRKSLSPNTKRAIKLAAMTVIGGAAIYGAMKYSDLHSVSKSTVEIGMKFVNTYNEKPQVHTVEKIIINPLKSLNETQMDEAQRYTMELLNRNNEVLRKMGY